MIPTCALLHPLALQCNLSDSPNELADAYVFIELVPNMVFIILAGATIFHHIRSFLLGVTFRQARHAFEVLIYGRKCAVHDSVLTRSAFMDITTPPTHAAFHTTSTDRFASNGPAAILLTLCFLNAKELLLCESVSKAWQRVIIVHDTMLWKPLLATKFMLKDMVSLLEMAYLNYFKMNKFGKKQSEMFSSHIASLKTYKEKVRFCVVSRAEFNMHILHEDHLKAASTSYNKVQHYSPHIHACSFVFISCAPLYMHWTRIVYVFYAQQRIIYGMITLIATVCAHLRSPPRTYKKYVLAFCYCFAIFTSELCSYNTATQIGHGIYILGAWLCNRPLGCFHYVYNLIMENVGGLFGMSFADFIFTITHEMFNVAENILNGCVRFFSQDILPIFRMEWIFPFMKFLYDNVVTHPAVYGVLAAIALSVTLTYYYRCVRYKVLFRCYGNRALTFKDLLYATIQERYSRRELVLKIALTIPAIALVCIFAATRMLLWSWLVTSMIHTFAIFMVIHIPFLLLLEHARYALWIIMLGIGAAVWNIAWLLLLQRKNIVREHVTSAQWSLGVIWWVLHAFIMICLCRAPPASVSQSRKQPALSAAQSQLQ